MGLIKKNGWLSLVGAAAFSMMSISSASAQCVVGGTDFETSATLCNPQLSNDAEGWFSADEEVLEEALAGCVYQESIENAIQSGMPSNVLSTKSGLFDSKIYTKLKGTNGFLTTNPEGMTAIVANPKLIDPILSEGNGTNMLVNAGTSHDKSYFLAYTINGLKPGSAVTVTMDAYYLIDKASMAASLEAADESQMGLFGGSVQCQISNTGAVQAQTPSAGIKWSTSLDANGAPSTSVSTDIKAVSGAQSITMKGTANSIGSVTFYVSRVNPNALPIGIDNIEVTGVIEPVISCAKLMPCCPENPVTLALKHSYPKDTKFEWTADGVTGSTNAPSFVYTPKEADKKYNVSCKVTLPGCTPVSASFVVETKQCCTQVDPVSGKEIPLAETNIFYDDFGRFPDDRTYEYTDAKGVVHTVPVDGGLWTDVKRPFSTKWQPGSTIMGTPYSGNGDITTCITNVNPYTPGVSGDASGTGRGGMLVFDVDKSFGTSTGLANKVLYEREICGLCKGKEITFSASFGAINNNPSGVGEMAIVLRKGSSTGEDLLEGNGKSGVLYGSEGWRNIEKKFTVQDNSYECVVLQVVNVSPNYGTSQGDFAIDDISFTVCTPPDVSVESSLTAEELLDLCTDKPLELKAEISEASKAVYGNNIGYLFQYTYQDPATTDDAAITWKDLSSIQSTGSFTIPVPANHEAFSPLADGGELNVFFRVVIGDADYLKNDRAEWLNMSALSPCRAISISSIPIIAALNCATCTKPDPVVFSAEGGKFKNKLVELCEEDGFTTLGMKNEVHGIDKDLLDYYDYTVTWYKETITSAPLQSKKCSDADPVAPTLKVNAADVTEAGVKYIISIHDNFDANPTPCDITDTIIVKKNPKPTDQLTDPDPFCENSLLVEPTKSLGANYELIWYTADDTLTTTVAPVVKEVKAAESVLETFYVVKDKTTGCRSDVNTYTITVNPIPSKKLSAEVADFCAADAAPDASPEATVIPTLPTSTEGTVTWYLDAALSTPAPTNLSTLAGNVAPYTYYYKVTTADNCSSDSMITFTAKPTIQVVPTQENICDLTTLKVTTIPAGVDILWSNGSAESSFEITKASDVVEYSVSASLDGYCASAEKPITPDFYPTPADLITSPTQYLKTEGTFSPITTKNPSAVTGAELGATVMWLGPSDTKPASTAGASAIVPTPVAQSLTRTDDEEYHYWVYQTIAYTATLSCSSELVDEKVQILGAPAPIVRDTAYCVGATAAALFNNNVFINQADLSKAYELVWELGAEPTVSTAAPTQVTYKVAQREVGTTNISSFSDVTVTVYGVNPPIITPEVKEYCPNDPALALGTMSTMSTNPTLFLMGDDIQWYDELGAAVAATTAPNTVVTAPTSYNYTAKQFYTIPSSKEICWSEPASLTVNVNFTEVPGDASYSYVAAEAADKMNFPSITTKGWIEEPGYTYYYALGANATTGFTTTAPSPMYDVNSLNGGSADLYYTVYRVNNTTTCQSEISTIKVTISDAMPPLTVDYKYCEGEALNPLVATLNPQSGRAPSSYSILWYGTSKPSATTDPFELEGESYPLVGNASVIANDVTTTTYWVAQRDDQTSAVSAAVPVVVTVYPNPVLTTPTAPHVCADPVDLQPTTSCTNVPTSQPQYYDKDANPIASIVKESGIYYVQYSYNAVVTSGELCKSEMTPITVTIDTLRVIAEDVSTCPNMSAIFTAEALTNATNVTYKWTGNGDSGDQAVFQTKRFVGADYGEIFNYTLTVNAGLCSFTGNLKVVLDEGPVKGTLTLADAENTETPLKVYTNGNTTEPYYFCGTGVTITPAYEGDADYELTGDNGYSSSTAPFVVDKAGLYTLKFTNGCPTSVMFIIKDASVDLSNNTPLLEMCEEKTFTSRLAVTSKDPSYTLSWMKDGVVIPGETSPSYTIGSTTPNDRGFYTAKISSHGCEATTEIGQLVVKPYIKVVPETAPHVVTRGESEYLNVIATPAVVENADWYDNGVNISYNGMSYQAENVTKDHVYTIQLSDPNYCDQSATIAVLVDAKLEIETDLADVLCEGLDYKMTIDTAGTGAFRQSGVKHSIKVVRTMNGERRDVSADLVPGEAGKLFLAVKAEANATFDITFTYGSQSEERHETVEVIPSISVKLPAVPTICAGEEATLTISDVQPTGTIITWGSDNTIQNVSADGFTAVVTPTYSIATGVNHQSEYVYTLEAYNETCNNRVPYTVSVKVDEPLSGELTAKSPICEGDASMINASSYNATAYSWTMNGVPVASSPSATVSPSSTAVYMVEMSRGKCSASDQIEVVVTSIPRILSMDSVGIRSREVVTAADKGTGMFTYTLDETGVPTNVTLFDDLSFSAHTIRVTDEVGCTSTFTFKLDPPAISIPEYFSPNGDGFNDNWVVGSLADVYPNALVSIYDRFGKQIATFLGADADGWDGTYKGVPLPSTDYWYIIDIEEIDTQYTGHFTLLRR